MHREIPTGCAVALLITLVFAIYIRDYSGDNLDAGRPSSPSPKGGLTPTELGSRSSAIRVGDGSPPVAASVLSPADEAHAAQGDPARTGSVPGDETGFVGSSLDELALMLTPESLLEVTTELWAQEEFDISPYERSALPTLDDAEEAYRWPDVQALHAVWAQLDAAVSGLQAAPKNRRAKGLEKLLEALRADRDAAYLQLCEALDERSGYHDWSAVARLYLAWCAQGAGPYLEEKGPR